MTKRKRMLAWSDSGTIFTGFGKITNYVLQALIKELDFEVDQVGVSYFGEFYDPEEYPWRISSANSRDPRDPSGKGLFLHSLKTGNYDYVWIQMDIQHVVTIEKRLLEIKEELIKNGKTFPVILYYVPIDFEPLEDVAEKFKFCDHIIPYTQYAKEKILESCPDLSARIHVIECGYDSKSVLRLSPESRKIYRKSHFGIQDDSTFLVLNVNRNSTRKMLPHVLRVYQEFREKAPNSKLYLHTDPQDKATDIDLLTASKALNLKVGTDVLFPENFAVGKPKSQATLTAIYNASDCFFTTAFGEGWGLTHTDAMATQVPVIAPNNTVFPEHLGDGKRGYLYPCKESLWFPGIGYRPVPRIEDCLSALLEAYADFEQMHTKGTCQNLEDKIRFAKEWIEERSIQNITQQWVQYFHERVFNS